MDEPPTKAPVRDLWSLRPSDLPSRVVAQAAHLQGLEHNAVYRYLIHAHRRHRQQRILLVAVYLGFWLFLGPLYGHYVLGADFAVALTRTVALLLLISIGIANIYIFAGIEGYETNGWLKRRFFDVITSGIPAGEIVRGILGKTVSHYPPLLVRTLLIGASVALLGIALTIPLQPTTVLFVWLLFLGVFGAYQLLGAEGFLAWVTIPGTLLWYRGVRRSYEQRLAEQRGQQRGVLASMFRLLVFIAVSLSVVLLPIVSYLYLGFLVTTGLDLPLSDSRRVLMLVSAYSIFAVSGFLCGRTWGWLARRSAEARLDKLEAELDRLFKIRGEVLFGGG